MPEEEKPVFAHIPVDAKHIVAVASGKGGVGKTTVTVNLGFALAEKGKRVGLLDADIYGPNVPLMMGMENEIAGVEKGKLLPINKYGIQVMSVAFISDPEKALIWRGPLANKLIEQFLGEVKWNNLDILLIDLPPGTGDVPLSIVQKAQLNHGIIVTTPQEASIADVRKMINMFRTTKTKILGIVENMKYMVCPHCSSRVVMHPNDDDRSISKKLGHNLIAEFPFDPRVGQKNAKGQPFYFAETDTDTRKEYDKLAETVIQAASR